ncbi:FAD-dependent oxidoreductase [Shinella sp.]|uniref:NAD(P)/FAD-dependent oxidoreductase n=1 Tax=Shinella sp. TaxID=1870904 RepID=UPI0025851DE3|nr:FAD-dependent oxidoreductase [Shinella sp.]MCW5706872.1 FAD-dependent oxidoreductase [Shinella sp.]
MKQNPMIIVGAGHAGCSAARTLRARGWAGPIELVNSEAEIPYERPPVSKSILAGERSPSDLPLFNAAWLAGNELTYRPSIEVTSLSLPTRRIHLSDGCALQYEKLLLATGSSARRLDVPGSDLDNVHYLRSAADAEGFRRRLGPAARLVIVGGGLIGLEVAATASKLGCSVTIVETGPQLLGRALAPEIERMVRAMHQAAGVQIRLGETIAAMQGHGSVSTVVLGSGESIDCDVVLVSIGGRPRTELAEQAGLTVSNGIVTDQYLRSSDDHVFAAGDVSFFPDRYTGTRTRLESWKNAEDQGECAAINMLGGQAVHQTVPWMWSDQFDKVIQIAGHPAPGVPSVVRPLSETSAMAFQLGEDGRISSVCGFGDIALVGRNVRIGQSMVERGVHIDPVSLANPTVELKSFLRATATT